MKPRYKVIIIIASLGCSVALIGLGLWLSKPATTTYVADKNGTKAITTAELTAADGVNGHKCWAAIDGTVYRVDPSANWVQGQHTPSGGLAYCGADLSKVIDQAPHGRKILDQLTIVGKLN